MPGYKYDGTATNDGFAYNSIKQAKGYTYAGVEIPLQEEHNIFYGKHWIMIGDSNFDSRTGEVFPYYTGISDNGSVVTPGPHCQTIITDAIEGLSTYMTNTRGSVYAKGGAGILTYFPELLPNAQEDVDVVCCITSPNEWKAYNNDLTVHFTPTAGWGTQAYDNRGKTYEERRPESKYMQLIVDKVVNPADDSYAAGQQTVCGRINDFIINFYNKFYGTGKPNKCKLCFMNGMPYPIGSGAYAYNNDLNNSGYRNVCKLLEAIIADWIEQDKLQCRTLGWLMPTTAQIWRTFKALPQGNRTYKFASDPLISIPYIIEKDPESPYYNRTIEPWHMTSTYDIDNQYVYAPYYLPYNTADRTVDNRGNIIGPAGIWGHYGYRMHERILAPIIAHLLAHALAPDKSDTEINKLLPTELKYNNI